MLTADGARRLRDVRDYIVAHPKELDMEIVAHRSPCGTVACIAGHLCIRSGRMDSRRFSTHDAAELLGFPENYKQRVDGDSLYDLFFRWPAGAARDSQVAADRINAFLWQYGYPPDEAIAPQTESAVEVGVHN